MPKKNKKQQAIAAAYRRLKKINSQLMAYAPRPVCERLAKTGVAEQLEGHSRQSHVCVLFTDIRGFTELSRVLDNQGLLSMVQRSSARQSELVQANGGYVDNYTGDCLMAIFEGENKVQNACECAVALIALVSKSRVGGKPLTVAVGVHVGPVLMGNLGSSELRSYTAIGETVNVAAKLCDHARLPEVIASNAVRLALSESDSMTFEPLPAAMIPGIEAHMPVYRLSRC